MDQFTLDSDADVVACSVAGAHALLTVGGDLVVVEVDAAAGKMEYRSIPLPDSGMLSGILLANLFLCFWFLVFF